MAAYRRVYDSHHLQADCQAPGSTPELYARQSSMDYLYLFRDRLTNAMLTVNSKLMSKSTFYMATEVNGQQLVVCYYISSRSWLSHVCMCAVARSLQASDV